MNGSFKTRPIYGFNLVPCIGIAKLVQLPNKEFPVIGIAKLVRNWLPVRIKGRLISKLSALAVRFVAKIC